MRRPVRGALSCQETATMPMAARTPAATSAPCTTDTRRRLAAPLLASAHCSISNDRPATSKPRNKGCNSVTSPEGAGRAALRASPNRRGSGLSAYLSTWRRACQLVGSVTVFPSVTVFFRAETRIAFESESESAPFGLDVTKPKRWLPFGVQH